MDQLIFQNTVWVVVLMASVIINWRVGYRKGVVDAYTHTTIPVVELLVAGGYLNVAGSDDKKDVDVPVLTANLVRLAMLRKSANESRVRP